MAKKGKKRFEDVEPVNQEKEKEHVFSSQSKLPRKTCINFKKALIWTYDLRGKKI